MQVPIEIQFTNTDRSNEVEKDIRARAAKLERFSDEIVSCRVRVDAPHKHHRRGKVFHVAVDIRVPGGEVIASRESDANRAHEDVYVAVRDAFNAARRQLQDHERSRRGNVKVHAAAPHGTITSMHTNKDFGWITTPDGRDVYFHRNSVTNADFDLLEAGLEVSYSEVAGERGPRARSVQVFDKTPAPPPN